MYVFMLCMRLYAFIHICFVLSSLSSSQKEVSEPPLRVFIQTNNLSDTQPHGPLIDICWAHRHHRLTIGPLKVSFDDGPD